MSLTGTTNAEKIWNYLIAKGLTKAGAAGLMGNLYAESALQPNNLQNTYEKSLGYTDATYTAAVDNGSYSNFVKDSAGYGLAQWTYWSRKQNLLNFAKSAGKSIGDLEMQLDFLMSELSGSYPTVLTVLKTSATVRSASDSVLKNFERPANMGTSVQEARASYGQKYYDQYAGNATQATTGSSGLTVAQLRQKVVDTAISYLGCKESDGSHKKIIDLYNSHKPLARGYAVQYTDAWCSTFASAIAVACELTDIIPTECGCEKHIELFKNLDSWVENDAYVPSPGDYIFYDWDDSGSGDDTGWADHVGIVVSVSGSTIKIIEGNCSDMVKYRTIQVNGRYIRGYGVPKYEKKATGGSGSTQTKTTETATTEKTTTGFSVGDVVQFTGTKHYTSSNTSNAYTCKPGKAKVTAVYNGKHPYHLIAVSGGGSSVYGWVDTADIQAVASSGSSSTAKTGYTTVKVAKGDTLWGLAVKYLGNGNRYTEIKTLNGLKSNIIYVGQALKIPEK